MTSLSPYPPRQSAAFRLTGLLALIVFCGLVLASLLHPVLHHDECCPEECEVALCLANPQVVPEPVEITIGLAAVDVETPEPAPLCPSGTQVAAVSRGPPSRATGVSAAFSMS